MFIIDRCGAALIPRPPSPSFLFCFSAACLLRTRDESGVLVQTVFVWPACKMLRLRLLRPPPCGFLAHSALLVASYSRPPLGKTMADAQPKRRAARERREEQAEATRNVRARVDAIETRADSFDMRLRQLDVRVQYIEQPHRWVLRGFDLNAPSCSSRQFQNNYAVAKGGFLAALIQEIRDHTAPACEALIEELETHLLEHNGLVMYWFVLHGGG